MTGFESDPGDEQRYDDMRRHIAAAIDYSIAEREHGRCTSHGPMRTVHGVYVCDDCETELEHLAAHRDALDQL